MKGKTYSNNTEEWVDRPKELWACLFKQGDVLYQQGKLYDNLDDALEEAKGTPCIVQRVYENGIFIQIT